MMSELLNPRAVFHGSPFAKGFSFKFQNHLWYSKIRRVFFSLRTYADIVVKLVQKQPGPAVAVTEPQPRTYSVSVALTHGRVDQKSNPKSNTM